MKKHFETPNHSDRFRFSPGSRLQILVVVFSILAVTTAILPGCSKDNTKPEKTENPYAPQTSPQNVVQNLTVAYELMDMDAYMAQMADDFRFVFCLRDRIEPGFPESFHNFDYSMERQCHTNLFSEAIIDRLELSFTVGDLVFDEGESSPADSLWCLPVSELKIIMKGCLPERPDMTPQTWQLASGSALFWLRRSQSSAASSDPATWEIVRCEETTRSDAFKGNPALFYSPGAGNGTTWGSIKWMFF